VIRRVAADQNVPQLPHEYQAIAQVLPAIGGTSSAHSGQSMWRGGSIEALTKATSMPILG